MRFTAFFSTMSNIVDNDSDKQAFCRRRQHFEFQEMGFMKHGVLQYRSTDSHEPNEEYTTCSTPLCYASTFSTTTAYSLADSTSKSRNFAEQLANGRSTKYCRTKGVTRTSSAKYSERLAIKHGYNTVRWRICAR